MEPLPALIVGLAVLAVAAGASGGYLAGRWRARMRQDVITLVRGPDGWWMWEVAARYETIPREYGTAGSRQDARAAALGARHTLGSGAGAHEHRAAHSDE